MVINKNELITDNQNTQSDNHVENTTINNAEDSTIELKQNGNFDLQSNNQKTSNLSEEESFEVTDTSNSSNKQESSKLTDIPISSEEKETVETNCLALTVRKDYNLSIVRNSIFTTLRISLKVAISTFVLNILKLFL